MADSGGHDGDFFQYALFGLNLQAVLHKELTQSQDARRYTTIIETNMAVMRDVIAGNDFDALLAVERAIQKVEMEKFSHDANMVASIQKTQQDLAEGMKDYRQLLEAPKAYRARGYREQDRTGPDKKFPLDTMRKALRGQATRVGNFAKNPMLFPIEKEFHLLRVSLLKRAEKLYAALQEQAIAADGQQDS